VVVQTKLSIARIISPEVRCSGRHDGAGEQPIERTMMASMPAPDETEDPNVEDAMWPVHISQMVRVPLLECCFGATEVPILEAHNTLREHRPCTHEGDHCQIGRSHAADCSERQGQGDQLVRPDLQGFRDQTSQKKRCGGKRGQAQEQIASSSHPQERRHHQ
jgi:hypothetical protein